LKDFCNPDKLKCPKHFAVIAKENRKDQNLLGHKSLHHASNESGLDYKTFSKPQPAFTKPLEEVITVDRVSDRSSKRDMFDQIDSVERKMFKAEKGGTFEWLAEKIVSIQKAADAMGNLSPEFKGIVVIS
jgi:hypothetical protein